jgi:hypothetical protein
MVCGVLPSPAAAQKNSRQAADDSSTLLAGAVYTMMYYVGYDHLYYMMGMIFLTGVTLGVSSVVHTTMLRTVTARSAKPSFATTGSRFA